jgi:hypothetical protein
MDHFLEIIGPGAYRLKLSEATRAELIRELELGVNVPPGTSQDVTLHLRYRYEARPTPPQPMGSREGEAEQDWIGRES